MDAFTAIERILLVHHSTTRQPISFGALRFRTMKIGTPISPADLSHILSVWPSAYTISTVRGQQMLECVDLPHAADRRRATFSALWKQKENVVCGSGPSPCSLRAGASPEPLLQRPGNTLARLHGRVTKVEPKRKALMGVQKQHTGNATSSVPLLERIRAKEARLKVLRSPQNLQKQTDVFLGSQVPKMKRVLSEIVSARDVGVVSFEIDRMMEVMRENMVKLGDDELQRCLELLSQLHPTFCSIVSSGDAKFVKLSSAALKTQAADVPDVPANAMLNAPKSLTV